MPRLTRAEVAARAACAICHARKVRCDAPDVGFPCSNCQNAERVRDCRVHVKRKRRPKQAIKLRSNSSASDQISGALTTAGPAPDRPAVAQLSGRLAFQPSPGGSSNDDGGDYGAHLLMHNRHLVEFVDQPHIAERPIDKNARLVYIGTRAANVNHLASQHFGERAARVCHFPTNQLARHETCHEPDRLPVEAFQLPPRAVVDQLLDAYFTHVNPGFPVVDETLFLAQYRARDPHNPPSLLLLQAILVVGAHVLYGASERDEKKAIFFRRAKILFDARFERNRDTIVQAALLLSWHSDGAEDVTANAWFWIGVGVRTAMGLGMHRDADGSTIVPHNKRMWRRIWWLLFQCDVLLSVQYGRPQSIHLEDCDVKPLQLSDFEDCGPDVQGVYVIHATRLCIIISSGLRERFRLTTTPEARKKALLKLDESLAQWSLQLPETLHLRPVNTLLQRWAAVLQLHYNMALLLLHRSHSDEQPERQDADVCAMAAGFIQTIFHSICAQGELRCLWISVVNCIFTALIQLNIELRTSNSLVALPVLMRYDATLMSLRQLAEYWPNAQPVLQLF